MPARQHPFSIRPDGPILLAEFSDEQRLLSWSITRPGFEVGRRVAWLEVRNADLPAGEDPVAAIAARMHRAGLSDAVTLVTSRSVASYQLHRVTVDDWTVTCLATVGLSNAERVGSRCAEPVRLPGTINTLVHVSQSLSDAALIETVSVVTQARTAAILDAEVRRAGVAVTGTGTDCIVVAAPMGEGARFAGTHTAVGEAVGRAVYRAIAEGVALWQRDYAALLQPDAAAE